MWKITGSQPPLVTVRRASPLPQAAHIGVSWVQRGAQANQEAKQQQDGRAEQRRHGPEGTKEKRLFFLIVFKGSQTHNLRKSDPFSGVWGANSAG